MTETGRVTLRVAAGLIVVFLLAMSASTTPGITWDETSYLAAGFSYNEWLDNFGIKSFTKKSIDASWQINHEHPPLAKIIYGYAGALEGGDTLQSILTARIFAAAMFTLLVFLIYYFVQKNFGALPGGIAAAAFVLMPRAFGDGHLAALDMPAALTIFAATAAFASCKESKWRAVFAGFIFGLALLTKLNAIFLPVVLIPWALWYWRKKAVSKIIIFLFIGSITFFIGWPWLWHDTSARVSGYITNKTERLESADDAERVTSNIPVYYLHTLYAEEPAPWHYPFVLTLVTVPLGLLLLAGAGAVDSVKIPSADRHPRQLGTGVLLIVSALVPLLVIALPMVPKYDGVRLFMPAFPFLACLAGAGAGWLIYRWRRAVIVLAVYLAAQAAILLYTHPYELSYYSPLIGGAYGANVVGFETTYWGDTVTRDVVREVNELLPEGATVEFRPGHLTFLPWGRNDIKLLLPGSKPPAQYIIQFERQGMLPQDLDLRDDEELVRQWTYLGIPQAKLIKRK